MLNIGDKLNRKLHMEFYYHIDNKLCDLLYNQVTIRTYYLLHIKVDRELHKYFSWGTLNLVR